MNNSPKILLIAPQCYPVCGPEHNVNAKFVKMLTDGGYVVDLISVDYKNITYPASNFEYFFTGVREKILVELSPQSSRFVKKLHSLRASLYVGSYVALTYAEEKIIKVVDRLCKLHKYDYVLTKVGGENAGIYCAKRYKIKLIYTFNDPWPFDRSPAPYGFGPKAPISWKDKQMMKNIAKISYKIQFPSLRLMNYMMQYLPNVAHNKGVVFPHTVTSALINNDLRKKVSSVQINHELRILYSGSIGKWRDPQVLFEGLRLFLEKNENALFKIQILGVEQKPLPGRTAKDYVSRYHLEKYVEILPPVSYEESLIHIIESDVCLILEAKCDEGIYMPTKITDYQQCRKPIWAISPAIGVLNDLYKSNDIDYFSEVTSAISVRDTFENIYTDFDSKGGILNCKDSSLFYDVNVIKEIQRCLDKKSRL